MDQLRIIRDAAGPRFTTGLDDAWIEMFLMKDARLSVAIMKAVEAWKNIDPKLYKMDEQACMMHCQRKFQSLYPDVTRQPYVPIAAQGPWMITLHGAVVHDNGGYGMLTFGHSPDFVLKAMGEDVVMANIMTASVWHDRLTIALEKEIGHNRPDKTCPYKNFVMLNSGSEGNSFITRLIDVHTGHTCKDRPVKGLVVKGSFHGRTFRAALLTDTTEDVYAANKCHLINKVIKDYKITVEQNNIEMLRDVFASAEKNGEFIESMFIEGVMGEGNPGAAISPAFYSVARELTLQHGAMLVCDNIQAGMRTTGNLSIVDFPGFTTLPPPDFEVWAKAINAGQYPCSLIALNDRASEWYRHGVYGNTMTGNPRACAVACSVLAHFTDDLRRNIVEQGKYVLEKYKALQREMPNAIEMVSGTGLLYAVKLNEKFLTVCSADGAETSLRRAGINVIHGGVNALRFTPNLNVTKEEMDMQVEHVRQFLLTAQAKIPEMMRIEEHNKKTGAAEGSAQCTFSVNGHLFDTQFFNKMLDLAESGDAKALVHNVHVGRNDKESSVSTLQVFAKSPDSMKAFLAKVGSLCNEHKVHLSLMGDAYDATRPAGAYTSKL